MRLRMFTLRVILLLTQQQLEDVSGQLEAASSKLKSMGAL